jgi:hypothetical protein
VATNTYTDNYLIDPATLKAIHLPDGDVTIESNNPVLLRVTGKKRYHKGGGAIWYDEIRDIAGNIYDLPKETGTCVTKEQFIATLDTSEDFSRVTRGVVCYDE